MDKHLYWDTSVFLCFLNEAEGERRKICEDILQCALKGGVKIFTSTYTIAEVIRPKAKSIPGATKLTPIQAEKIGGMFRWPFITTIELDERTARYAAQLARDHNLAAADSVHAASAILWREEIHALQAWDRDFSAIKDFMRVQNPSFLSPQPSLEGMEGPRVGPHPEDFIEDLLSPLSPQTCEDNGNNEAQNGIPAPAEPAPAQLRTGGNGHLEDQAPAEATKGEAEAGGKATAVADDSTSEAPETSTDGIVAETAPTHKLVFGEGGLPISVEKLPDIPPSDEKAEDNKPAGE